MAINQTPLFISLGDTYGVGTVGTTIPVTVTGIQGTPVLDTPPTNGQILQYVSANSEWEPVTIGALPSVSVVTISLSTLALTSSSANQQYFIGTVGGQTVRLPDATTLTAGANTYLLVNTTPTIIPVYLNDGTTLLGTVYPDQSLECTVYNISTSNGLWFKKAAAPSNAEQSYLFDDFIYAGTTTNAIGNQAWTLTSTVGTATWTLQSVTNSRLGVGRLATSTSASSGGALKLGTSIQTVLGNGIQMFEAYVSVPTLGGAGAAALTARVGLGDGSAVADEANGIYFQYTGTAGGTINWSCKTASASSRTTVDSGVAVSAGTWYKLCAVVDATATNVDFYINNIYIVTITTNIPTAGISPAIRIVSGGTNAAAKNFDIDFYQFMKTFTVVR